MQTPNVPAPSLLMWQGLEQAVLSGWWEALALKGTMKMEKTEGEFFLLKWEAHSTSSSFHTLFGPILSLPHQSMGKIVNPVFVL